MSAPVEQKKVIPIPVVNIGLQRARDLVAGTGTMNAPVNSIGFGSDDTAEAAADTRLGGGSGNNGAGQLRTNSYWKSAGSTTLTTGGDGTADPWWQREATFSTSEANVVLYELGSSAGTLTGTNPAGNNGTALYSRKRIGGSSGIGKTSDIELVGRVRVTY